MEPNRHHRLRFSVVHFSTSRLDPLNFFTELDISRWQITLWKLFKWRDEWFTDMRFGSVVWNFNCDYTEQKKITQIFQQIQNILKRLN